MNEAEPRNIFIISHHATLQQLLSEHLPLKQGYQLTTVADAHLVADGEFTIVDEQDTIVLRQSGVHGSQPLARPFRLQQLIDAINQHYTTDNGELLLAKGLLFYPRKHQLVYQGTIIDLTEKETALISYLHHSTSEAVSKTELLEAIWQYDKSADTHTVETHIYRLRQKAGGVIVTQAEGYRLVR